MNEKQALDYITGNILGEEEKKFVAQMNIKVAIKKGMEILNLKELSQSLTDSISLEDLGELCRILLIYNQDE